MLIQIQTWHDFKRVLIANSHGSVQVELYDEKQEWGGTAFIYGLWVEPQYRRQGEAKALLRIAEDMAGKMGHKSVMLEWKERDTLYAVLKWYTRSGYTEREFSGNGDYYLLEKQLKGYETAAN